MGRKLAVSVVLPALPGSGETFVIYGPESDDIPEEHAKLIGDHAWEDGGDDGPDRGDGPPPKSGKGSGKEQWAAYAAEQQVAVPDDASRDDIIAALVDAGVSVEQS